MVFGRNMKRIRQSKGMTQRDLGLLCGISVYQINRYEKGVCAPNIEQAESIARALSSGLGDMLTREE